jgi:hypothetical protein
VTVVRPGGVCVVEDEESVAFVWFRVIADAFGIAVDETATYFEDFGVFAEAVEPQAAKTMTAAAKPTHPLILRCLPSPESEEGWNSSSDFDLTQQTSSIIAMAMRALSCSIFQNPRPAGYSTPRVRLRASLCTSLTI